MAERQTYQTPTVRLSFPNIETPQKRKTGDRYNASLILTMADLSPRDREKLAAMKKAAEDHMREKFGNKAFDETGKLRNGFGMPFKDGADKLREDEEGNMVPYDGYGPGTVYFNVNTARKPGLGVAVRDGNSARIEDTTDASVFYPGCYVQAVIHTYPYDTDGNKGISFGLDHLIFIRDGEPFGAGAKSASDAVDVADIDVSELQFDEASSDTGGGGDALNLV